jgi:hypothetical protein
VPVPGQDRRREHECDRCPVLGECLESGTCLRRGGEAHDVVVARVTLEQLALDLAQARCVPVDGEQHGPVHGSGCYSSTCRVPLDSVVEPHREHPPPTPSR